VTDWISVTASASGIMLESLWWGASCQSQRRRGSKASRCARWSQTEQEWQHHRPRKRRNRARARPCPRRFPRRVPGGTTDLSLSLAQMAIYTLKITAARWMMTPPTRILEKTLFKRGMDHLSKSSGSSWFSFQIVKFVRVGQNHGAILISAEGRVRMSE
jgi:hypothetical protein